jgi:hypothetical protein
VFASVDGESQPEKTMTNSGDANSANHSKLPEERNGTALGGPVHVRLPEMAVSFARGVIIQAWLRPDRLQNAPIVDLNQAAGVGRIALVCRQDAVELQWHDANGTLHTATSKPCLAVGAWVHLSVVLGVDGVVFYRNGSVLDAAKLPASTPAALEAARACNYIGRGAYPAEEGFAGAIADVRLWNRSAGHHAIVARHARALRGDETGLVGHWTLEGEAGVRDASCFGRDGVRAGGAFKAGATSLTIGPALDHCRDFDGDDEIKVQNIPPVRAGFTWQARVLVRDLTRRSGLFAFGTVEAWTQDGAVSLALGDRTICATGLLKANTWMSLAVRRDDLGNVVLFADGVPVGTSIAAPAADASPAAKEPSAPSRGGSQLLDKLAGNVAEKVRAVAASAEELARRVISETTLRCGEKLVGQMAEVRLWARALTSAEIADTAARRIHGWAPGLLGYWRLDEDIDPPVASEVPPQVTIFADGNFSGTSQSLGVGRHDVGALTIGNDKLSSLRVPQGLKVTLYEHGGFAGKSWVFTTDTPLVANNDMTSSIVVEQVPPQVTIFADGNFAGASQSLGVGRHDFGALTIGNDKLSSLRVPQGLKVTLYEHGGFAGKSWVFTADTPLVANNDMTSSIVVEAVPAASSVTGEPVLVNSAWSDLVARATGTRPAPRTVGLANAPRVAPPRVAGLSGALEMPTIDAIGTGGFSAQMWVNLDAAAAGEVTLLALTGSATVYRDFNFTGPSQVLRPGSHDVGALNIVGNDQISSLRASSGIRVTLYEHGDFKGRTHEITGVGPALVERDLKADIRGFMSSFDNKASSIKVEGDAVRVLAQQDGDAFALVIKIAGSDDVVLDAALWPRRWTHLTITQDADGLLGVYLGGRLVSREERRPLPAQTLAPRVGPFAGSVTELRLWPRALTRDEVEATWQRRAVGAPTARWALAGDLTGTSGPAAGAAIWREAPSLAIKDPKAPAPATVHGRASLLADPTGPQGKPQICVDLTARDANGRPVPGAEIAVIEGAPVETYRKCVRPENRIKGEKFTLTADMRGAARLVLQPTSLRVPILKVRHPGMGEGEWALVTPDQVIFDALASLTEKELTAGRRATATTRAGTTGLVAEDADALLDLLRGMHTSIASFAFEAESTAALAFGDLEDEDGAGAPVQLVGEQLAQVGEDVALVRRLTPPETLAPPEDGALCFWPDGSRIRRWTTRTVAVVDKAVDTTVAVVDKAFDKTVDVVDKAFDKTVDVVTDATKATVAVVDKVIDKTVDVVLETVETVSKVLPAPVARALSVTVNTMIGAVKVVIDRVVKTVEDIAEVAVDIFEQLGKTALQVLDYLAEVFDWSDILDTTNLLLREVNRAIGVTRSGMTRVFDTITQKIDVLESMVLELLGGAPLPPPAASEEIARTGWEMPQIPGLIDLLLMLLPDDLELFKQTIRDLMAVFDPIKDVLTGALGRLPQLVEGLDTEWNAPALKAAFADPQRFLDSDPSEWKALARLFVRLIANGTKVVVDFIGDLLVAVVDSFKRLLDLHLNLPYLTPFVEEHILKGDELTVGRMLCLLVAIPLTTTYKVITGSKRGPAELDEGPQNFADSGPKFVWTLVQRAFDWVVSVAGAFHDGYEAVSGVDMDAPKAFKWALFGLNSANWVLGTAGLIVDLADDEDWGAWEWIKFLLDGASAALGLAGLVGAVINLRAKNDVADKVDAICGACGDACGVVSGIIDVVLTATDDETSRREVAVSSLDLASSIFSLAAGVAGAVPKEAAQDVYSKPIRIGAIIGGSVASLGCKTAAFGVYIRDQRS